MTFGEMELALCVYVLSFTVSCCAPLWQPTCLGDLVQMSEPVFECGLTETERAALVCGSHMQVWWRWWRAANISVSVIAIEEEFICVKYQRALK